MSSCLQGLAWLNNRVSKLYSMVMEKLRPLSLKKDKLMSPITVPQSLQAVPRQRQQVDLRAQTQSWVK